ncbi:MAG: hypothetical protein V1859_07805 [archaeon]
MPKSYFAERTKKDLNVPKKQLSSFSNKMSAVFAGIRKRWHVFLIIVILLLFIIFKVKFVTTLTIGVLAGILQFLVVKYQLRIDVGHIFFLGVLLAKTAGGIHAIALVFLAGLIPKIIGGDIDPVILIAYIIQAIVIFISLIISRFFSFPIIFEGIVLSIIAFGLIFLITVLVDFQPIEVLDDSVAPAIICIILFATIGEPLYALFKVLYS